MLADLVAGITGGAELVERDAELDAVLGVDGLGEFGELARVERGHHRLERDPIGGRIDSCDVSEAGLELIESVLGELPVIGCNREPELGMPNLLQNHEL